MNKKHMKQMLEQIKEKYGSNTHITIDQTNKKVTVHVPQKIKNMCEACQNFGEFSNGLEGCNLPVEEMFECTTNDYIYRIGV